MATQLRDAAWLEWMAGLMGMGSRQTVTATLPPGRFHCLLDELPLHLIPPRHFAGLPQEDFTGKKLLLNPQCQLLPPGQLPAEWATNPLFAESFYLQGTMAWVRDARTGSLLPFWLGPRLEAVVSRLQAGELAPGELSVDIRSRLVHSGILVSEEISQSRASRWAARLEHASHQFSKKSYAPLSDLIHPYHLAALRRYYRYAIRQGKIRLGDEHVPRRYVAHNDPVAQFFHQQMGDAVGKVVGEAVKPSYVYLACYVGGAELKKHTDREQCEFSVTLCLDFSPEPDAATSWPICLDTPEGAVAVYQALGDGLVYRGTKLPHYRSRLAEGYSSTSIFFHYVPEDFEGSLE